MTVRQFDGINDDIIIAIGTLSNMQYGTVAYIVKLDNTDWATIIGLHDLSDNAYLQTGIQSTGQNFWWNGSSFVSFVIIDNAIWFVIVLRKLTGNNLIRYSIFNYNTLSWVHGDSSSIGDATAPGIDGQIRFSYNGGEFYEGRIAVRGVWSNTLPWSPDETGDTEIENAGLELALTNWINANPSALWKFNQDSVEDPVNDITGNGADQISITGTTVVTDDDPPNFDFSEGDMFEPILAGTGSLIDQIMTGLISQGFITGSIADRERARLLAKLTLSEPQNLSLQDLYRLADEPNRLAGL